MDARGRILLVFAKAPRPGRVKTRLSPPLDPEQAAALQRAFVEDALERALSVDGATVRLAANDAGDPFLRGLAARRGVTIASQGGGDLGARMHRALAGALDEGYGAAAVIGSDSPTVPRALVAEAFERLARVPVVLGPAADGGYWLVGLTRPAEWLFTGMPWGTSDVLPCTIARLERAGLAFALLGAWFDVDTAADLARLREDLARGRGDPAPATRRALAAMRSRGRRG